MRHARAVDASGSSPEVRIAAAMVGAGAVLGVLLLVAAGLLFTADPGFLFAVLPVVIGFCAVAGLQVAGGSVFLARKLLSHAPGARLTTASVGAALTLVGLMLCVMRVAPGFLVLVYGVVLFWLMLSPGAARDLGPWFVLPTRQPYRWRRPAPQPWDPQAVDPRLMGMGPPREYPPPSSSWQRPQRTWIELWQEGLSRPFPIVDLVALCIALAAFAVGDVLLFVGLWGHDALLPLAVVLIGSSIGVVAVMERRLKKRLGYV